MRARGCGGCPDGTQTGRGRQASNPRCTRLALPPGEVLPPLKVVLEDRYGNPVTLDASAPAPQLSLSVMAPGAGEALEPCTELQVLAQKAADKAGKEKR